jgi:hypothetical protein
MGKTEEAFGAFRDRFGLRPCRRSLQNDDEKRLLTEVDGLQLWQDGPSGATKRVPPVIEKDVSGTALWAIRPHDVVYAEERCEFGQGLANKVIKHSNLTGAEPAHSAGELLFVGEGTIALNGSSGRYGPESVEEMDAVAKAFRDSGYGVWSYGYDEENAVPFRFGSRNPEWVE